MAKAKKSKARKSKAKKSKAKKSRKTKKPARRAAAASRGKAKKSKARKAKKAVRKAARPKAKAKKSAAPRKRKQIVGEGDYQASRNFLKDEAAFVKRHSTEIPAMGKDAEAALEGPEGGALRTAEEEARSHNKAGDQ